jgi:hypothetical protein
VEFYSSLVSKELKGEEEMGQCRFSGGSEGGMTSLQFGSSRVEEDGSQWCTSWWHGRRGGGADGSRSFEPMEADWAGEVAATGLMQRKTKEMVWTGKKFFWPKLSKEYDGCRNAF